MMVVEMHTWSPDWKRVTNIIIIIIIIFIFIIIIIIIIINIVVITKTSHVLLGSDRTSTCYTDLRSGPW